MALSQEHVPKAEQALMTRSSVPITIKNAQKRHGQAMLDIISRTARLAKSPAYLKPDAICSRPRCSRCLGQLYAEGWLRLRYIPFIALSVEEATKRAAKSAEGIMEIYAFLAAQKRLMISRLRALSEQQVKKLIIDVFPGLQKEVDLRGWNNVEPRKSAFIKGLPFGSLTYESIISRPEIIQELIVTHASRHPADCIQKLESDLEFGWNEGLCPTATSACFVDLTKAEFGTVKKPVLNGLHSEGTYTFLKGYSLLYHQFTLYKALAKIGTAFPPDLPQQVDLSTVVPPPDTIVDPLPALHEALQGAIDALKPAQAAVEKLILANMSSGEMLERHHNERATWCGWTPVSGEDQSGERYRKEAFHMATAEPLMNISMLYSLERDASRCRTTARDYSRKRATKAALLRDWESLELALMLCVEHFGLMLLWTGQSGTEADLTQIDGFEYVTNDSGIRGIAEHQQLLWVITGMSNHPVPVRHRISQMLKYLDARSDARSCFHDCADFVFLGLPALQKLIDAMELLQPVSAREYEMKYSHRLPDYGGAVAKQDVIIKMFLVNLPEYDFHERTWEKLGLGEPGAIRAQYKEAWGAVFGFVDQVWRQSGMDAAIVSRVLDLRRRGKVPTIKPDANKGYQEPRLPAAAETQVQKAEEAPTPLKALEAPPQQVSAPTHVRHPDVKESPAPARHALETPSRPRPVLFSEMQRSFAGFQFQDRPSRPSMFPEEITWAEKQQRRNRNDSAKESSSPEEREDSPITPSPDEPDEAAPSKIVFADAKTYKNWRTMFPLHAEGDNGGKLKFDDLCALLTSPPLNFRIAGDAGTTLRFHREKSDGWPEGVVTIHKGHGWNPKVTKHELDNIKKDLRREFGRTAEDFELAP